MLHRPTPTRPAPMAVWVVVEVAGGVIPPASLEMLGGGRRLAEAEGAELAAVVLGRPGRSVRAAAMDALAHGADTVYVVEDDRLVDCRDGACGLALAYLVGKYRPRALLVGATAPGRQLADRLHGMRLGDCAVHRTAPLGAAMPRRDPERAGHIVVEPSPLAVGESLTHRQWRSYDMPPCPHPSSA